MCGFLVKPVREDNLRKLLGKTMKERASRRKKALTVQYKGGLESLPYSSILYLESNAHQISIVQPHTVHFVYGRLDDYAEEMREDFVRIHKQFSA